MKKVLLFLSLIGASSMSYGVSFKASDYKLADGLSKEVLGAAIKSVNCALKNDKGSKSGMTNKLAIIDFSMPSDQKRLWILDLKNGKYVVEDYVSHGVKSGNKFSNSFSNIQESHQSSIGLFKASESYYGSHGYSLRLDGLEKGVNDNARKRNIVIHSANYVSEKFISSYGRAGRSHGCPAVDSGVIKEVVDNLKGGQYVFKYYPDDNWLKNSPYLNCNV